MQTFFGATNPVPQMLNGLSNTVSLSEDVVNYMHNRHEEEELMASGASHQDAASELETKERDLVMAAQLGQVLLNRNQELARRNEALAEEFQQKIWALEQEKQQLKMRLEAAESDYDAHVRDLHRDIGALRGELHRQAAVAREVERENATSQRELTAHSDYLAQELSQSVERERQTAAALHAAQHELRQHRVSMQEHMHQLEVMRDEIGRLRDCKAELESRLLALQDERDQLLCDAEEQADRLQLMERVSREQRALLADQAAQIEDLTETAESLQERLHCLSLYGAGGAAALLDSGGALPSSACDGSQPQNSCPESLLMEMSNASSRPFSLFLPSCPEMALLGAEEEECEVDDDDFVLRGTLSDLNSPPDMTYDSAVALSIEQSYMSELRAEVLEVYHQLKRMCAALIRRRAPQGTGGAAQIIFGNYYSGAGQTPDELALVEMDFRLGSLREVLGDLKALLRDIVALGGGLGGVEHSRFVQLCSLRDQMEAKDTELREKQAALDQINQELSFCQQVLHQQEDSALRAQQEQHFRDSFEQMQTYGATRPSLLIEDSFSNLNHVEQRRERLSRELEQAHIEMSHLNEQLLAVVAEDAESLENTTNLKDIHD